MRFDFADQVAIGRSRIGSKRRARLSGRSTRQERARSSAYRVDGKSSSVTCPGLTAENPRGLSAYAPNGLARRKAMDSHNPIRRSTDRPSVDPHFALRLQPLGSRPARRDRLPASCRPPSAPVARSRRSA